MTAIRRTRQLEAVRDVLRSLDHPTASSIHERVQNRLPSVSLGTVYRNLDKLMTLGEAITVHVEGQPTRYDGTGTPHGHFFCERCRGIIDLAGGIEPGVDTGDLERAGYLVRCHALGVFGICRRCDRAPVAGGTEPR